jgi:hypothetical protein
MKNEVIGELTARRNIRKTPDAEIAQRNEWRRKQDPGNETCQQRFDRCARDDIAHDNDVTFGTLFLVSFDVTRVHIDLPRLHFAPSKRHTTEDIAADGIGQCVDHSTRSFFDELWQRREGKSSCRTQ